MSGNDDNWTSIAIRKARLNGLRFSALQKQRSPGSMLDLLLDRAGIPEMSDEELAQKTKEMEVTP